MLYWMRHVLDIANSWLQWDRFEIKYFIHILNEVCFFCWPFVVEFQAMSYAKLAGLEPIYGLCKFQTASE